MKKYILILLSLIYLFVDGQDVFIIPFTKTPYYVKNGGNDALDGLTDATAWEHHPWMSTWTGSAVLQAGDIVCMKRGNTWTIANPASHYLTVAQNGTAGNYITTTAYGTGAKPIINISTNTDVSVISGIGKSYVKFDNLDVSHYDSVFTVATDSRWKGGFYFGDDGAGNVSHDWIITNCDVHDCPVAGIRNYLNAYNIAVGDTTQTATATSIAYSNHVYNCGYYGVLLVGRDPTTNISNFKVYYNYIHDVDAAAKSANSYGITFTASAGSDGFPAYCYARYNKVTNVKIWTGVDCHGGRYIYIQDNYVYNCKISIGTQASILAGATTELDYCYVERNILENPGNLANNVSYFIQMDGNSHTYPVTNGFIRDNTIFFTARPTTSVGSTYGISTQISNGVVISGNTIYNGFAAASAGAIYVAANSYTINNNWILNWGYGMQFIADTTTGTCAIYNNIIHSCQVTFYSFNTLANGCTYNIYNNTFFNIGTGSDSKRIFHLGALVIQSGGTLNIKNNIIGFTETQSSGWYINTPSAANIAGTCDINYNLYWNNSGATPFQVQGGDVYSLTNFLANTTYEDNSPNGTTNSVDPLFTNGGGTYQLVGDFSLGIGSPALNVGVNTGVTTDYYGNARVGNYDIGAVEKQ
jgi:hypothetical protein